VATPTAEDRLLSEAELRARIERWASLDHGSASPGERAVAAMIADELGGLGLRVRTEEERVHGTYWWPIGLLTGLAALGGVAGRALGGIAGRALGTVAGVFAAAAVADDIGHARRWFRRRFLPKRTTVNVTAEIGDPAAERTLVFIAHHDAAHSGLVFHPALPREWGRRFPKLLERTNTTPGALWGAFYGPLLVGLGSLLRMRGARRLGAFVCAGYALAMADVGRSRTVPGANDNLSGVAVLVSLARALAAEPPDGVRVVLLSTGSEESFSEGMQAWGERHFPSLPRETTTFVCLDTVGSPQLALLEGEGMLGIQDYSRAVKAALRAEADELGVFLHPNLRFRNATDAVIALKAGYETAMIGSCDEFKAPSNYHWPTDVPENLDYGSIANCARVCLAFTERLEPARARPA
jgi:hypothetical protein